MITMLRYVFVVVWFLPFVVLWVAVFVRNSR